MTKELQAQVDALIEKNHINYERAEAREKIVRDMIEKEPGEHDVAWLRLGAECAKDVCKAYIEGSQYLSDYMNVLHNWLVDGGVM